MLLNLPSEKRVALRRLYSPLQLVFWGALLFFLHPFLSFRVGDRIATTEPLAAALALALLAIGTGLLGFGNRLGGAAGLVASGVAAAYLGILAISLSAWFVPRLADLGGPAGLILGVIPQLGLVALSWCLWRFTRDSGLLQQARSWAIAGFTFGIAWLLLLITALTVAQHQSALAIALAGLADLVASIVLLRAIYALRTVAKPAPTPHSAL